jgi:DNA-binding NarL/FixJ family response regulator
VRLVSNGEPLADAAKTLELDEPTAERHLASALAKLGADDIGELPRQARRHGLGGGA